MFWNLECEQTDAVDLAPEQFAGRFVLHRHHDEEGPHLDLRLEQDGYLLGWRIDGAALDGDCTAREKAPHPVSWLDRDGDAVREDAGLYAWIERNAEGGRVILRGTTGDRVVRVTRVAGLPAAAERAVCEALRESGLSADAAGRLIRDGVTARRRAVARFRGLGRELDGNVFDEAVWRRTLDGCSLDEIHAHLRAYEFRFDEKYPPQPVSRPAPLDEETAAGARDRAFAIVRQG
ncbi:MAG TPA: hypothetical protein PKI11_02390 [Candidatus Hydrogenedentes bacterium]|nr:hypothetical protein [Candidatus Hydrogenedentota bacterium]